MLQLLRKRRDDEGFTLIELMVVVLIIAILIAIAIPTFLGARQRAQDRAAQSNIRNAFTAEKVYYTDNQAYTASSTDLDAIEPSLEYDNNTNNVTVVGHVGATVASGVVTISSLSASGKCFWLQDDPATGTTYGSSSSCGTAPASYGPKW